jgi:hypothetical protein
MRVAYIGNFGPPFSTENDIRQTLVDMHVEVDAHQEDYSNSWRHLTGAPQQYDAILWTSTRDLAERIGRGTQLEMLYQARRNRIPTIGFHLDRWWGLQRWRTVLEAPFFRCEYVFTADGAHQEEFAAAGVNHHWSPPAIAPRNIRLGEPDPRWKCDVAFVGSWQGGYHQEWQHRPQLVDFLRKTYKDRVRFFPEKGQHRIVGNALADLYATAKVVVGDSCLVPTVSGEPMHHYCSDRVFETLGRGGCLIHPFVEGVIESGFTTTGVLRDDTHLGAWNLGDWDGLRTVINRLLNDDAENLENRRQGYQRVAEVDTYANRLEWIFNRVGLEGYTPLKVELPPQVAR